jgi:hypothetical protein
MRFRFSSSLAEKIEGLALGRLGCWFGEHRITAGRPSLASHQKTNPSGEIRRDLRGYGHSSIVEDDQHGRFSAMNATG